MVFIMTAAQLKCKQEVSVSRKYKVSVKNEQKKAYSLKVETVLRFVWGFG